MSSPSATQWKSTSAPTAVRPTINPPNIDDSLFEIVDMDKFVHMSTKNTTMVWDALTSGHEISPQTKNEAEDLNIQQSKSLYAVNQPT